MVHLFNKTDQRTTESQGSIFPFAQPIRT